jgi:hypothetical protein
VDATRDELSYDGTGSPQVFDWHLQARCQGNVPQLLTSLGIYRHVIISEIFSTNLSAAYRCPFTFG